MAKGEEPLGSADTSTIGVAVPGSKAMVGGMVEAVTGGADAEVRLGEPLLLQDLWYCSTFLFPAVGATKVSPPSVPKKWILKGEALSHETIWVQAASGIIDMRFQRKELLLALIQFWCPCGTTVGWFDWVEQEVTNEGFCQILRDAKIFETIVVSRGWNMYRDVRALHCLVHCWNLDTHTFFFP